MTARVFRAAAVVLGAAVAAAVVAPATAQAGGGHDGVTTIATGLDNPRGLAFGPDGSLYVAESGKGGAGPCFDGPEGKSCLGQSGAITKISHGKQARIASGLPSLASPAGTNALGPTDVAVHGRSIVFTVGLGTNPANRDGLSPDLGSLRELDRHGHVSQIADLAKFEAAANPDGGLPDSNPTSVALTPWGSAVVTDAGGNSLVEAGPHGKVDTLAVFPNAGNAQAVPTGVARGWDGAYYVGQLTGFPFAPGSASVFKVWPGHKPEVFAGGFTTIIDVAQGGDGSLYVLQIAKDGLAAPPSSGALIKVDWHGKKTTVLDTGLTMPGGLTVRGHDAYISNCGVCPGGGSVVRVPLS